MSVTVGGGGPPWPEKLAGKDFVPSRMSQTASSRRARHNFYEFHTL